jgi:hypothetical protein
VSRLELVTECSHGRDHSHLMGELQSCTEASRIPLDPDRVLPLFNVRTGVPIGKATVQEVLDALADE